MPYKDPIKQAAYHKAYRARVRDKHIPYMKAYVATHKFENKVWRQENKEHLKQYHRNLAREQKAVLVAYKGGKCLDCGGIFPNCCMEFDHRDPFQKSFSVTRQIRPIEELKIEADKCDLVCANCHAIRTFDNPAIKLKISIGYAKRPKK